MNKLFILSICTCLLAGCKPDTSANNATPNATTTTTTGSAEMPTQGAKLTKLESKDVKVGTGNGFKYSTKPVENGDKVIVTYKGKLAEGTVFDTNQDNGKPPFSFVVGEGSVIPGWDRGLIGMVVGGERNLSIPSSLGYGEAGQGQIPPNADLYFNIKLLDVVKKGEEVFIYKDDKKTGSGKAVRDGAKVTIRYSVKDVAGKTVDTNHDKPISFTIGKGQGNQAIETGMIGPPAMKEGGIRALHIGPQFALAGNGVARNMPQTVSIELVKVQ